MSLVVNFSLANIAAWNAQAEKDKADIVDCLREKRDGSQIEVAAFLRHSKKNHAQLGQALYWLDAGRGFGLALHGYHDTRHWRGGRRYRDSHPELLAKMQVRHAGPGEPPDGRSFASLVISEQNLTCTKDR
jgi:hypothetical protein